MKVNRREFIQITGATAVGLAVSGLGFDLRSVKAHAQMLKTKYAKETTTICCYCAVGCGAISYIPAKKATAGSSTSKAIRIMLSTGARCARKVQP